MTGSTQVLRDRHRDWEGLEESPELQRLVGERRRFVLPALATFVVLFGGFRVLTAYARDFMAKRPIGSFSWAYLLALGLIVMTWVMVWLYLRWSQRQLVPLTERIVGADAEGER